MNQMPSVKQFFKKIWVAVAILIIFAAVVSSIFRSLTPWAKQYKGEVEQHLSALLGQPVTIQTMETGWYWFEPVLKLQHISIHSKNDKNLELEKLLVGINIFKSLWEWQIQPGVLYLDKMDLVLREKEGHWTIDGITTDALDNSPMTPEKTRRILVWLAEQQRLIVKHLSAHLHFSNGDLIPVSGLTLSVVNKGGYYKIKGEARLSQTSESNFELAGDLFFDPYHPDQTKGRLFFSAQDLIFSQWQGIINQLAQPLEGGKGSLSLWLDFKAGMVDTAQAQVHINHLAWRLPGSKKSQFVQTADANLSWKRLDSGWQIEAAPLSLRVEGIQWPENKLSIRFDKTQNSYLYYIQSIPIDPLLTLEINWPEALKPVLAKKPQGLLKETQFAIKDQGLQSLLTRFDKIGWESAGEIPAVTNLSGVIHWQPQEGHLELDSEDTTIAMKGYPSQHFELLNGALEWKALNDGLRLSLDRFVLSQKELTLSAEGSADKVSAQSVGQIQFKADFAGKNLQKWAVFLPKKHLKPKLYEWLEQDIQRIGQATGKISLNGVGNDFPFDKGNGEFSIQTHLSDVDMYITQKWQMLKHIDGYINLKNRNLSADLVSGDFHGVPVKEMNLRIDDIGKDKELLLIHTKVHANAQKMLDFVLSSPLKQKLSSLSLLRIQGLLGLDLHLEIPLYPENDRNLANGVIAFDKNNLVFAHQAGQLGLNDLSGSLSFTEKGIEPSQLTALFLDQPISINLQTKTHPQTYTAASVTGEASIDSLKNQIKSPFLDQLKGQFAYSADFKFTDTPDDFDTVVINTSLQGLAVHLPEPLGKSAATKRPLEVKLGFNAEKGLRVQADYDNRISTDLMFHDTEKGLEPKSGQVRLGGGNALDQKLSGIEIIGKLDGFPLQEWSALISQWYSEKSTTDWTHFLRIIDVQMGKLTFLNQQFDGMKVKAKVLSDKSWRFTLAQKNVAGDLTYQPGTRALSGYIHRLHLPDFKKAVAKGASKLHPQDIPNLNLRVDNLSLGSIELGDITLKSQSDAELFSLDYCRITSPVYQIDINGSWSQKNKVDKTKTRVQLHVNDLAKTLKRWDMFPAVDAGKGDMEFVGGWNKSLFDFSLSAVNGSMSIKLKKGIITHLSPETEEKLGLGKLLSILSLQTIPRRLQLDFSDLSHEGYSFDIFKGDFTIKKGIMNTEDSYLDGPVAYAAMKGDLDLVRRLYDLDLTISPHITASLPIVATIAGGPVAGLAAWVANKLINQGMQKIIAYSYKISGPWNEPVVQQLSLVRQVEGKKH